MSMSISIPMHTRAACDTLISSSAARVPLFFNSTGRTSAPRLNLLPHPSFLSEEEKKEARRAYTH
eukprot:7526202-Pyramimonas_sp.AAC.1